MLKESERGNLPPILYIQARELSIYQDPRSGSVAKVRVVKGFSCRDTSGRLILEHFHEEVEAVVVDLLRLNLVAQIEGTVLGPAHRREVFDVRDSRPCLLSGLASLDAEDFSQLRLFALTLEKD